MAAEVEVTVAGVEAVANQFKAAKARVQNLSPVFAQFAGRYREMSESEVFDAKQSPEGEPWAPLAASTEARHPTGILMQRTGDLRGGIFARPSSGSLTIGASVDYARFHQTGTRHMPARPVVPFGGGRGFLSGPAKAWHDDLKRALVRYILTGQT